jgi:hypothetical protein
VTAVVAPEVFDVALVDGPSPIPSWFHRLPAHSVACQIDGSAFLGSFYLEPTPVPQFLQCGEYACKKRAVSAKMQTLSRPGLHSDNQNKSLPPVHGYSPRFNPWSSTGDFAHEPELLGGSTIMINISGNDHNSECIFP